MAENEELEQTVTEPAEEEKEPSKKDKKKEKKEIEALKIENRQLTESVEKLEKEKAEATDKHLGSGRFPGRPPWCWLPRGRCADRGSPDGPAGHSSESLCQAARHWWRDGR